MEIWLYNFSQTLDAHVGFGVTEVTREPPSPIAHDSVVNKNLFDIWPSLPNQNWPVWHAAESWSGRLEIREVTMLICP